MSLPHELTQILHQCKEKGVKITFNEGARPLNYHDDVLTMDLDLFGDMSFQEMINKSLRVLRQCGVGGNAFHINQYRKMFEQ